MIYFIRHPDQSIKIGTAVCVTIRLRQLEIEHDCNLEGLAVAEGSYKEEKSLHERFAHHRIHRRREWFRPGDDLIEYIRTDAQPWDAADLKRDDATVKFDRILKDKLSMIVQRKGGTMSEYLSELCRPHIEKEYARVVREMANEVGQE